jgi:tetratricopeptide (TPR) repeat protein
MTELTIDQALRIAIEAHKSGKIQEAYQLYKWILNAEPKHADANHNMGVLTVGIGKVQDALPFFKAALETNHSIDQYWLSYIHALIKLDRMQDAKTTFDLAKSKGAKGDGFDKIEKTLWCTLSIKSNSPKLPQKKLQILVKMYEQSRYEEVLIQTSKLLKDFPNNVILYNIFGAANQGLGKLKKAVEAYKKAILIKPDYAEVYNNMGLALTELGQPEAAIEALDKAIFHKPDNAAAYYNLGKVLQEKGKLEEAIEYFKKSLDIEPNFVEAYNNIGNALKDQGKLDQAIEAYKEALSVKPDYATAYNNMGNAFQDQDKLHEAIEAYNNALNLNPNFVEAYNNMGKTFQDLGKLQVAKEAFKKALTINPDFTEAHRHLSILTKYTPSNFQISVVDNLLKRQNLSPSDRCNLYYTYAKMKEDLGDLAAAFDNYLAGGQLRKKLLSYNAVQDQELFDAIKRTAPQFKYIELELASDVTTLTPIFIIGMPRSGTTLVEQIVSSHTQVTGAGELAHLSRFGNQLALGVTTATQETLSLIRECYLAELAKKANGQAFITDKTPQNFRYIALICTAFPEAKIIHVKRNAEATCWSNFKHFFSSKHLGYSYNLADTVKYFCLYKDLMQFWLQSYTNRIYNLDYDKLTKQQELETRRLIEYLGLKWEDACLAPQNNNRPVKTASQLQVQKKVYEGSSEVWREYKPFLKREFDDL